MDNDVFELVDLRKVKCKNFVRGRWVLTVKRDKDGNFLKCKARWVLQGFLDKQKDDQQTDSPTASRPGFRMACQFAANGNHDLYHVDLRTAFLQGEAYDHLRDVICQLPSEAGHPPYIAARLKRPAYGLNDAPRRWWNIIDKRCVNMVWYLLVQTVVAMFYIVPKPQNPRNKFRVSERMSEAWIQKIWKKPWSI